MNWINVNFKGVEIPLKTPILVTDGKYITVAYRDCIFKDRYFYEVDGICGRTDEIYYEIDLENITHWQHLPNLPI